VPAGLGDIESKDVALALASLAEQEFGLAGVGFAEVLNTINAVYVYDESVGYSNGDVTNAPGVNTGSAKVFAFAQLHALSQESTVRLFCEHLEGVLADPSGDAHANIRAFLKTGWEGVAFDSGDRNPLSPRTGKEPKPSEGI